MIEHLDNDEVLIIVGNLPGVGGYFDNYPDVTGEDKTREHELSHELIEYAKDFLSEYDPKTSTSKSNSGNRSMMDIYVTVDQEKRDEVVLKTWKMLNYMKEQYIESLSKSEEKDHHDYPSLKEEVLELTKKT